MNRFDTIFEKIMFDYQHTFDDPELQMIREGAKEIAWMAVERAVKDFCTTYDTSYNGSEEKKFFEAWWNQNLDANPKKRKVKGASINQFMDKPQVFSTFTNDNCPEISKQLTEPDIIY